MESAGIDWSRFDTEEAVRELNREKREKRLGKISMIMGLQEKINELKITFEIIKGQKEAEAMRQKERDDDDDRLCRESYQRNEREREEKEERRRIDDEWRNIKKMRYREERKAEKEWKHQNIREKRKEERRQIVIEERKLLWLPLYQNDK